MSYISCAALCVYGGGGDSGKEWDLQNIDGVLFLNFCGV